MAGKSKKGYRKLNSEQVEDILEYYHFCDMSLLLIARRVGVCEGTVKQALKEHGPAYYKSNLLEIQEASRLRKNRK